MACSEHCCGAKRLSKVPSHHVQTGEAEGHSNMQGLLATPQNHCIVVQPMSPLRHLEAVLGCFKWPQPAGLKQQEWNSLTLEASNPGDSSLERLQGAPSFLLQIWDLGGLWFTSHPSISVCS